MQDGDSDDGDEQDEFALDEACLVLSQVRFSLSTLTPRTDHNSGRACRSARDWRPRPRGMQAAAMLAAAAAAAEGGAVGILYYTILYSTIPSPLFYSTLYYNTLYYTILCCTIRQPSLL